MRTVYLNGEFLPLDQAKVSVLDRGFLFGDGVYEVIPVYEGQPFRLDQHLKRLQESLDAIHLFSPLSNAEWQKIIAELLQRNQAINGNNQMIYLQVTRGVAAERLHAFPTEIKPTVFLLANPSPTLPIETLRKGMTAVTLPDNRWESCYIKTISLLANVLLFQQAREQKANEAILLRNGLVIEGATSNVFVVKNGQVKTPPLQPRILSGVTRAFILELAKQNNILIQEIAIKENELRDADEIWISSSTKEIHPIISLDQKPVGRGIAGPLWEKMMGLYHEYLNNLVKKKPA